MSGLLRYVELTAKAKIGLDGSIVVWGLVGAVGAIAALSFISMTAFVWIARAYDPLTAAASIAAFYLLVTGAAVIAVVVHRRNTIARARAALAERSSASLLDPGIMALGFQVARVLGWRRIVPLALIAVVATGLAREWTRHDTPRDPSAMDD